MGLGRRRVLVLLRLECELQLHKCLGLLLFSFVSVVGCERTGCGPAPPPAVTPPLAAPSLVTPPLAALPPGCHHRTGPLNHKSPSSLASVDGSPAHMVVTMTRRRFVALAVLAVCFAAVNHLNARYHIANTPRDNSRHERLNVVGEVGEAASSRGVGVGVGVGVTSEDDADEVALLRVQLHDARAALAVAEAANANAKVKAMAEARRGWRRSAEVGGGWAPGRVPEPKHSTDVQSPPPPPRVRMCIHSCRR